MWPRNDLQRLLGIDHPILQAPMAGASGAALATAVSEAGGLGAIGSATLPVNAIREQSEAVRARTNRPFNLNFFVHKDPPPDGKPGPRMRRRLAELYAAEKLGDPPPPSNPRPAFNRETLELILDLRPPVVSFHFGLPEDKALNKIKKMGSVILASATTVAEARWLADHGCDIIIAQGIEAGGHRGTFLKTLDTGSVGTVALVPQIVDAVDLPVIAAGGIADGRGIAAAFALGAAGVQIGTAFLSCPESTIDSIYRERLTAATDDGTRVTKAISGRPARAIRNFIVEELADVEHEAAPFPVQLSQTAPLKAKGLEDGRGDYHAMWAGQAAALAVAPLSAAERVRALVADTQSVLDELRP